MIQRSSDNNGVQGNLNYHIEDEELLGEDEARQLFPNDVERPTQEELFDSLLPPFNHLVIPNANRRRAHTVDAAHTRARGVPESTLMGRRTFRGSDDDDDNDDSSSVGMMDLNLSIDFDNDDDGEDYENVPASPSTDLGVSPRHSRAALMSLTQEDRLRRRQNLLSSRCMRGFLLLCVYAVLVLKPSLTNSTSDGATLEPLDLPTAPSEAGAVKNNKTKALVSTRTVSPLVDLPRFHHRTTLYHSLIPPNSSTNVHKIPPSPPHVYHKKQRPILSHAHSYQLHQEPLVFGRELKASFLIDSSDFDRGITTILPVRVGWGTTLIWLSLLCLLCDTCYREWQHYRWLRLYNASTSSRSLALEPRSRRHRRRSPSPMPLSNNLAALNNRRTRQQQPPPRPRFDSF